MKKKKTVRKNNINVQNTISSLKLKIFFVVILLLMVIMIGRLAFLQIIDGAHLKTLATSQQTLTETISAKRGSIYDVNGQTLAMSYETDKIYIDPENIKQENREEVAKNVSEILNLDYQELLNKINSSTRQFTVATDVEQDKVDKLNAWKSEVKYTTGLSFEETSSRNYPYGTVASTIIGFTGADNKGSYGIELSWDSFLSGTAGKSVSLKDASQSEIVNSEKSYIAAENGYDITLTIDVNIQQIIEKYLAEAIDEYECDSGITIAMNPSNGKIYAMADYPNYDCNNHNTPYSNLAENWDLLTSEEKSNSSKKISLLL